MSIFPTEELFQINLLNGVPNTPNVSFAVAPNQTFIRQIKDQAYIYLAIENFKGGIRAEGGIN